MTTATRYDENAALFREKYDYYADKVLDTDPSSLQMCETRCGESNLKDTATDTYVHSSYSVRKETEKFLEELQWPSVKDGVNVLYVYGVGVGDLFHVVREWLDEKSDRYLIFFEDDLRIIKRLLETDTGRAMLQCRQVMWIYPGTTEEECDQICEDLAYYFVKLPVKVAALPHYARTRQERFQYVHGRVMHSTVYVSYGADEFLSYGCTFYRNFYHNLQHLPNSHKASGFYNKFSGIPAIICGAGPSLNKNFDLLQTLNRRALIFAGGSAINALTNRGLQPHFGATVDPNKEQWRRMSTQSGFAVPFFYKGRTYHKVMPSLFGPKIFLGGNVGYPVSDWIEQQLGIDEPFVKEGHNVLHLTIDLAQMFGCNPIIFVGMDLAYTDMQVYGSDVVAETQVSEEELTKGTDLNSNSFLRDDIHGNPVYTLWKWVAESHYTAKYAKTHPQTTFINATEGGIGVSGVENVPLKEVAEQHLTGEYDLEAQVSAALEQARFSDVSEGKIREVLQNLRDSLQRCEVLAEKLHENFGNLQSAIENEELQQVQLISEEIAKGQSDFGAELAQVHIIGPVNHIRSILYERRSQEIEGDEKQGQHEQVVAHCASNKDEMVVMIEAARLNKQLIDEVLETIYR